MLHQKFMDCLSIISETWFPSLKNETRTCSQIFYTIFFVLFYLKKLKNLVWLRVEFHLKVRSRTFIWKAVCFNWKKLNLYCTYFYAGNLRKCNSDIELSVISININVWIFSPLKVYIHYQIQILFLILQLMLKFWR